jgi:hypothetical protein
MSINYFGKQPDNTSYVKTFSMVPLQINNLTWVNTTLNDQIVLTPANNNANVYIKNDLTVGGSINNPSDLKLKENIKDLNLSLSNNLMKILPKQYTYKSDKNSKNSKIHFGIIAQELEQYFPNLVTSVTIENDENVIEEHKVVNYIELIPLLLVKIQDLQKQIDILNLKYNKSS